MRKFCFSIPILVFIFLTVFSVVPIQAAPGTLLSTVNLPGNVGPSVSGTLAVSSYGTHYMSMDPPFATSQIGVYVPCVGNPCNAIRVATKTLPVAVSGLAWDPTRTTVTNVVVWGGHGNNIYLIDLGDPTISGPVVSQTFWCNSGVGGIALTDGLAYDASDDTLYESPDIDLNVYQLSLATQGFCPVLFTITPENAAGVQDGDVSGVAIGASGTLYIGRNGWSEIRHINNPSGTFISQFATTAGRVEALTCDQITHAPLEAILAKDALNGLYEAFEVAPGTCPLGGHCDADPRTQGYWHRQCLGVPAAEGGIDPGRNGRGPNSPTEPDFASDLMPEVDLMLENNLGEFGGSCAAGMDANPPSDPCERAIKQFTALLFNQVSNRLQAGCEIDVSVAGCNATTVAELVDEVAGLINSGNPDSCRQAADCAGTVNEFD
jgi:hypothetical protein